MPNIPGYNSSVSNLPALSVGWLPPRRVGATVKDNPTCQLGVGVSGREVRVLTPAPLPRGSEMYTRHSRLTSHLCGRRATAKYIQVYHVFSRLQCLRGEWDALTTHTAGGTRQHTHAREPLEHTLATCRTPPGGAVCGGGGAEPRSVEWRK